MLHTVCCSLENCDQRGGDKKKEDDLNAPAGVLFVGTYHVLLNTTDCGRQACIFHIKVICNLNYFACTTLANAVYHTQQ